MGLFVATILLVDDDRKILDPLQKVLEAEGYGVLTATNGEAALEVTANTCPSLVVTDWMMPCVDGVQLCQRLKANRATSDIPVILLSAALPPPPTEQLWDMQLMKPVPIARLLWVIRTLLGRVAADA
jgi:DNA-binding response OmpR family regulator